MVLGTNINSWLCKAERLASELKVLRLLASEIATDRLAYHAICPLRAQSFKTSLQTTVRSLAGFAPRYCDLK